MIFKAYLKNFQFFPIVHLADKQNHSCYNSDLINNAAKIYFFVKSKNYFSNIKSSHDNVYGKIINNNGYVQDFKFDKYQPFTKMIEDSIHKYPTEKYLTIWKNEYSYKLIGSNIIVLIDKFLPKSKQKSEFFRKLAVKFLSSFIHPRTNLLTLFRHNIEAIDPPLHLYQFVNSKIINVKKDFLESNILYIGKSDSAKGILKGRIYKHEKTLPILGEHGTTNDEILVFIFEIVLDISPPKNISKDLYIPAVEEILIRYFMKNSKNTKNEEYIITKTGQTKHIKDLINQGFTKYYMELNFDDEVCRFGTDTISYSKKHIIQGELANLHQVG